MSYRYDYRWQVLDSVVGETNRSFRQRVTLVELFQSPRPDNSSYQLFASEGFRETPDLAPKTHFVSRPIRRSNLSGSAQSTAAVVDHC